MQTKKRMIIALCLLAAVALGYILNSKRITGNSTDQVVRMYKVPVERVDEVRSTVSRLLDSKEGGYGNAQVFGSGLLLVRAPLGIQKGVNQLVEELAKLKSVPAVTVHLDFWVVLGSSDQKSNSEEMGTLSTVLTAIDKVDGPRKYKVIEHITSNSIAGREVKVEGWWAKTASTSTVFEGTVNMNIEIDSKFGQVRAQSQAEPGEFLVLGQNVVAPDAVLNNKAMNLEGNIYYIIRPQVNK